jgi:hypothetical protein
MKLMVMHKVNAEMEAGALPKPELVQSMGALIGEMAAKGVFQGGEGLGASATRARVRFERGEHRVEKGPYAGRHELVAGYCLLRARSLEEAIGWTGRLARALGEGGEVEVGPVHEPWDFGAPVPEPRPLPRFLALAKADAKAESGTAFLPRVSAPLDEMKRADVLIAAAGLAPSAQAKRVQQRKDRRDIVDGPFAESKELIAGYAVMQVASWEEALDWSTRFARIIGSDVEMDLRPVE